MTKICDQTSGAPRGGMMGGGGSPLGQQDWPSFRHGMMRVHNAGYLTHEPVVLPLLAGQTIGSRVPS